MKIQSLLVKAKKCKTEEDAQKLLTVLQKVFGESKPLRHLYQANDEAYMEDGKPFVRFEMNRVINEDYITMIRPEIRDGVLVVVVETNRMLDGLGMASQNWELMEGMDDVIECRQDQSVLDITKTAAELAIAAHRSLIESVGVPAKIAKKTARLSW